MYICEYCGGHFKDKYKNCPNCGGDVFKKIQNFGEEIIKHPPQNGYKINLKNYEQDKKVKYRPNIIVTGILFVIMIGMLFPFIGTAVPTILEISNGEINIFEIVFSSVFVLIPLLILTKLWENLKKELDKLKEPNEKIRKLKHLSKNGWLIKNLKYTIKPIEKIVGVEKDIYIIQVIYEIEKGKTQCFESEPKYLTALGRGSGTVDLLIDPNDYTNYYIDFEIC